MRGRGPAALVARPPQRPTLTRRHLMSTLGLIEILIILGLGAYAFRELIRRRWPAFKRRLDVALISALVAVVLYRLMVYWHGSSG